ncbi:MAG: hypothetical protein U0R26_09090 [Solirubrobacterales bacterium]
MIKVGVVGLGKMGLSHHALLHAHPDVEVVARDSSRYVLGVLQKNTDVSTYGDYEAMLADAGLDARWWSRPRLARTPAWSAPPSTRACTCSARSR